jgi:hypothetical protein
MRHSVSREEVMKGKQYDTPARPPWSLNCFNVRIGIECWFGEGWREVETLWRILLQQVPLDADRRRF